MLRVPRRPQPPGTACRSGGPGHDLSASPRRGLTRGGPIAYSNPSVDVTISIIDLRAMLDRRRCLTPPAPVAVVADDTWAAIRRSRGAGPELERWGSWRRTTIQHRRPVSAAQCDLRRFRQGCSYLAREAWLAHASTFMRPPPLFRTSVVQIARVYAVATLCGIALMRSQRYCARTRCNNAARSASVS
jgi:hypothetical protein